MPSHSITNIKFQWEWCAHLFSHTLCRHYRSNNCITLSNVDRLLRLSTLFSDGNNDKRNIWELITIFEMKQTLLSTNGEQKQLQLQFRIFLYETNFNLIFNTYHNTFLRFWNFSAQFKVGCNGHRFFNR